MWYRLVWVELFKMKRSLALLAIISCPFVVVLLNLLMLLRSDHAPTGPMYWLSNTALWCYFMYPLFIALVTTLLNSHEHRANTWRVMFTMPITPRQLFIAKWCIALLALAAANSLLMIFISISMASLALLGIHIDQPFAFPQFHAVWQLTLAALPILTLQHWLSWHLRNFVAPLAVGIAATLGIMQIGQSSEWIYYPWSYAMMVMNASSGEVKQQALQSASVLAAVLSSAAFIWAPKRAQQFR